MFCGRPTDFAKSTSIWIGLKSPLARVAVQEVLVGRDLELDVAETLTMFVQVPRRLLAILVARDRLEDVEAHPALLGDVLDARLGRDHVTRDDGLIRRTPARRGTSSKLMPTSGSKMAGATDPDE